MKEELSEKRDFQIMSKVIMKHHEKNKLLSKQVKESKAKMDYILGKKKEGENHLKQNLRQLNMERD